MPQWRRQGGGARDEGVRRHRQRLGLGAEPGENVVFSWIVWPSKAVRDEGNKKMMADPRMKMMDDMPFDGKRMIFGGFSVLLDTGE